MECPFIHKFKNGQNKYIYDVNTNKIFNVNDIVYNIIDYIYDKEENIIAKFSYKYSDTDVINAIKSIKAFMAKEEVFLPNRPQCLDFFNQEEMRDKLKNELNNITLIITERCNMRCKYCIYSGIYHYERTHSQINMSEEIAYNAIDFIFNHSKRSNEIIFSFYGGEPLLNFPLIKKSIIYIKKRNKNFDKKIDFSITTNGTLLNDQRISFLVSNKIAIALSLDGPKAIHDRYRIYPTGRGTYNKIFNNLIKLKKKNEDFFRERVVLNMVLTPPFDLFSIDKWFNENKDLLNDIKIEVNMMIPFNNKFFESNKLDRIKNYCLYLFQEKKLLYIYLDSIIKNERPSLFLITLFEDDLKNIHLRREYKKFSNNFRMSHLCIPGKRSLLVDVKGKLHFCPNVSSNMAIGNVKEGFEFSRIFSIVSQFINISQDCLDCWAIRLCNKSCYHIAAKGEVFDINLKKKICSNIRKNIEIMLAFYCELQGRNPNILNERFNQKRRENE